MKGLVSQKYFHGKGWKVLKIAAIALSLCMLAVLSFACSSGSTNTSTAKTQTYTVQKGDIALYVTGTGNLALSDSQNLAFEIAGTVAEVLVEEGDSVTEGQVLAKLDTSEWDKQIKTLEKTQETAKRNLTTKEDDLTTAQRQISEKEMVVKTAELAVESAKNDIANIEEVKEAQDDIDTLETDLTFAKQMRQASVADSVMKGDVTYWNTQVSDLTKQLTAAQDELQDVLDETSVNLTSNVALQIASAQLQLEQKEKALENAKTAVEDASKAVSEAKLDVADAEQAVEDAQSDLDEQKSLSPIIKAPSAGFVSQVNVKGGDEVLKGTVAIQIADPNQFKAVIQVTEQDIFSVQVGAEATVSLDALSELSFPAKVTAIAPTATVSSGVVTYKVTVKLTSLVPTGSMASDSTQKTTPTTTATQSVSLKDGLSAVVDILVQGKTQVLLVPSRAITKQGTNTVVQVINSAATINGAATETRLIKTGISDETYTEITSGLSEGEKVLITLSSSSSSSTSSSSSSQGGNGMAGLGLMLQ